MIKIRKLLPAELAERIKEKVIEPKLYKRPKPIYVPNIDEILARDEFIKNMWDIVVEDEFILSKEQKFFYARIDRHLDDCFYCQNGEYCENLGEILAA